MRRVLNAPNAPEAHVAVAALDSAGIEAVIRDEHMGALPLGAIARPSVWVRDEDYAAACEVLGVAAESSQSSDPVGQSSALRIMLIVIVALLAMLWLQR